MRRRQGRTLTIQRDILDPVIVHNVGLSGCIREGILMLLTRRAVTRNESLQVDNLEHTLSALATQDIEPSVVQFRLGDPCNINMTCVTGLRTGRKLDSDTGSGPPRRKPGVPTSLRCP